MATHSSTLAWNIPWTEEPGKYMLGKSLILLVGGTKNFKLVSDQVILLFRKITLAIVWEKFR